MTNDKKVSRRNVLKKAVTGMVVGGLLATEVHADSCQTTPDQTEGPFYPEKTQKDKDNDLTLVKGHNVQAQGEVIYVFGQVTDDDCKPVERAIVEIWQACASGKYNHEGDPNPAPLDPHFQYWGRCATDANGRYNFKTIIPGAYPATPTWMRPPHIHFKVFRRGYHELTSQLYFSGNKHNKADRILQALSREEQSRVITTLRSPDPNFDYSQIGDFSPIGRYEQVCHFDIAIKAVQ